MRTAAWKILNRDNDRITLIDDDYLLIVTTYSDSAHQNFMSYDGKLPDDYEVILKMQMVPQYDEQAVRLGLTEPVQQKITPGLGVVIFAEVLNLSTLPPQCEI